MDVVQGPVAMVIIAYHPVSKPAPHPPLAGQAVLQVPLARRRAAQSIQGCRHIVQGPDDGEDMIVIRQNDLSLDFCGDAFHGFKQATLEFGAAKR